MAVTDTLRQFPLAQYYLHKQRCFLSAPSVQFLHFVLDFEVLMDELPRVFHVLIFVIQLSKGIGSIYTVCKSMYIYASG